MKKVNFFVVAGLFLGMFAVTSCGDGGAAEAEAKRIADSLTQDSIAQAMAAQALREAFVADSLAAANAAADSSSAVMPE